MPAAFIQPSVGPGGVETDQRFKHTVCETIQDGLRFARARQSDGNRNVGIGERNRIPVLALLDGENEPYPVGRRIRHLAAHIQERVQLPRVCLQVVLQRMRQGIIFSMLTRHGSGG